MQTWREASRHDVQDQSWTRTGMREKVFVYTRNHLDDGAQSSARRCLLQPGLQEEPPQGAEEVLRGACRSLER